MTGYLTNVNRDQHIEAKVRLASALSGLRVEYRDHPMPYNGLGDGFYKPENYIGMYGSIYTYENYEVDLGPFWREYEKLKEK